MTTNQTKPPPIKIKKSDLAKMSQDDLASFAREVLRMKQAARRRSLESYLETAHEGQMNFHRNNHRIRIFAGSNRSGKSTGGCAETLFYALGNHPFRRTKLPLKGAIVAQDFETHVKNIIEPKMNEWAPEGSIVKVDRNQQGAAKKFYMRTGTTIDIYSHDQDLKVFEGSDYDFVWFDEPPPRPIFNAMWRGCTDRGGSVWITCTPLASPWLYREMLKAENGDPLWWLIYVDIEKNALNIGEGDLATGLKRIHEFSEGIDPAEREARLKGVPIQMQGLIFKEWKEKHHLIAPFAWNHSWRIFESIDPHPQKDWAVSWIGYTPSNHKILLRSGYFGGTIKEIANQILFQRTQIETQSGSKARPYRTIIDNYASVPLWQESSHNPDRIARRTSVKQELEGYIGPSAGGPVIEVAPKNVMQKIELFRGWLKATPMDDGKLDSQFYVFDNEENEDFVTEIENYVWDSGKSRNSIMSLKAKPKKEDDDILDTVMQVAISEVKPHTENAPKVKAIRSMNSWTKSNR